MLFKLPEDPNILIGFINMKLRDYYSNMDVLCDDLDLNLEEIDNKLNEAGFYYDNETRQYHQK